jgi:aminoglycoside 6'-N-acetyltransferase I
MRATPPASSGRQGKGLARFHSPVTVSRGCKLHDFSDAIPYGVRDPDSVTMASVSDISIRLAQLSDRDQLARFREALWPKSSAGEHARELTQILEGKPVVTMSLIILVAEASDRALAGFLEVDLRSHADGCNPSRPVGYIEGWYVAENYRHKGVGRKLLAVAEDWARSQGCVEIASDTWVDNEVSQRVHEALGYEVVDRCVHYRKTL